MHTNEKPALRPSPVSARVAVPQHPITAAQFERANEQFEAIVLDDRSLGGANEALFAAVVRRNTLLMVILSTFSNKLASVVALSSDYLAARRDSKLQVGQSMDPLMAAGLVSRIGDPGIRFAQGETRFLDASALVRAQICQNLVPDEVDSVEWTRGWLEGRHPVALASAAMLVRDRGGDAIENAEFGRLFAAGLPQVGLQRFLNRDRSPFGGAEIVETL